MKKITLQFTLFLAFSLVMFSVKAQTPSLKFNGTDNVLEFSDYISSGVYTPILKTHENHSWEMWVKGSTTTKGIIYTEGTTGSNYRGQYRINANGSGKIEIEFRDYGGDYLIPNNSFSSTTVFDGTWHHIAVVETTSAGTTATVLFVDGIKDVTNFGSYTRPTTWVNTVGSGGDLRMSAFGSITRAGDRDKVGSVGVTYDWYDGEIDEFRAWGRSLTQAEIADNMCTLVSTTELYRHVAFDEESGIVFASVGSNSRNGNLLGVTASTTYSSHNCILPVRLDVSAGEVALNVSATGQISVFNPPSASINNANFTNNTEVKWGNLYVVDNQAPRLLNGTEMPQYEGYKFKVSNDYNPIQVTEIRYILANGTDTKGAPGDSNWIVQASNDDTNWDTVSALIIPTLNAATENIVTITTTQAYRYYRFVLNSAWTAGQDYTALQEANFTVSGAVASVEDDILTASVSIYPNPTNERLNIKTIDASIRVKDVVLMDVMGEIIYKSKSTKPINVSSFSKGIYFLRISSENGGVTSRKIIID